MTSSKEVQKHFEKIVKQGPTSLDQQLVFEPTTGDLVVQKKGVIQLSPDAVVADSITQDGFFGNYPS
jgi:hypothetical protein